MDITDKIQRWVSNLKEFLKDYLLKGVHDRNVRNIEAINQNLFPFSCIVIAKDLSETMLDEAELNKKDFYKRLEKNLSMSSDKLANQTKETQIYIYYADSVKIRALTELIDKKLNDADNSLFKGKSEVIKQNFSIISNLLKEREQLNNSFAYYQTFESNYHKMIYTDYSFCRVQEFTEKGFADFHNEKGAKYKREVWRTALPSDSQLLNNCFLYFVSSNRENEISQQICVFWPTMPSD